MSFTPSDVKTVINTISEVTSLGIQIVQAIRQAHQITSFYGIVRIQVLPSKLFEVVLEVGYKVGISGDRDHLVTVKSEVVASFDAVGLKKAVDLLTPEEKGSTSGTILSAPGPHTAVSAHPMVGMMKAAVQTLATKWLGIAMTNGLKHTRDFGITCEIEKDVEAFIFNPIRAVIDGMQTDESAKHLKLKPAP